MDRLMDVSALALTAGAGALLLPGQLDPRGRRVFLLSTGLVAIGLAVVIAAAAALPAWRFPFRIRRKLARLRQAARGVRRRPHLVIASLAGGVAVQSAFVTLTAVLANACGLHLRLRDWFFAWPLAKIAALLPLSQGGLGVREAALAALLVPFGAPAALAVAVGLVWQTVIYSGGLISGCLALVARGISSRQTSQAAPLPPRAAENARSAGL